MTASLATSSIAAPLRPLAETAALFRQECSAFDHLVADLYRDVEQLRDELFRKSDEIEEGRRKLAQRGAQLADQRKETARLVHLVEQQEARLNQTLAEIKSFREQATGERQESFERETKRIAALEEKLRSAEEERDVLRQQVAMLQAASSAGGGGPTSAELLNPLMTELTTMRRQLAATQEQLTETQSQFGEARSQLGEAIAQSAANASPAPDPLPTLMAELAEMRRQLTATQEQLTQTQSQLGDARTQLAEGIERAAAAAAQAAPAPLAGEGHELSAEAAERLAESQRERIELEAELELVRTRATELQEVVNQQRRELVEQRADVTTELRLLRELVEQHRTLSAESFEHHESLVPAGHRGESASPDPDPVVSSVMAQFARLQKDVAQRRKKK